MVKVNLKITISVQGPVLTQSSTPGDYGIDAPAARTADGTPYLPGTLVLGRLRQSLEELSEASSENFINKAEIEEWFGKSSDSKTISTTEIINTVAPFRKKLQATDFVAITDNSKDTLYRIRMDKKRGTVETGAYLVIDSPFAPGSTVLFEGVISHFTDNESHDLGKIEKGLRWITSFGAERTIGFGQLLKVDVKPEVEVQTPSINYYPLGAYYKLRIHPRGPFCLARRQVDKNLFESEEIIPGNVIKGGLATTWGMLAPGKGPNDQITAYFDESRQELAKSFDKIRFTHAFPLRKDSQKRPVVAPLSLIKYTMTDTKNMDCEHVLLEDMAHHEKPRLFGQPQAAPTFSIDWKESGDVKQRFGWPDLQRELRVRTAMDRKSRRSKDQQLFAYEMIVPDDHEWEAMIDLSRITEDRDKVLLQLIDLLSYGMNGWGKTKAFATTFIAGQYNAIAPGPSRGMYVITLQTPALLCDPHQLNEASGHKQLYAAYSELWKELSGGSLELVRFFASQSLTGGFYLHQRFQPDKDYHPWLLTDAGSVFVLKQSDCPKGAAAQPIVKNWLWHGLPLPDWANIRYGKNGAGNGNDWQNCPYIPQNGFGEIAVNIDLNEFPESKKEGCDE